MISDPMALTPVERHGALWVKRDDLFEIAGVRGGKARTAWVMCEKVRTGITTAGSRHSPQVNIIAHIARHLGVPCRVHVPDGPLTPDLRLAQEAGAVLVRHRPGYNSVIISRAARDAAERGWEYVAFGMECDPAVYFTGRQVANLDMAFRRIVVPVGSGMSLAGILWGIWASVSADMPDSPPVLGVTVGADPERRLDKYAPVGWRYMCNLTRAKQPYHEPARITQFGDLALDPYYEAKCFDFLEPDDVLWIVGIRQSVAAPAKAARSV
ncbi:MAG: pyridoxal-phosphate dependent enzyme [Dehalococcoidia bacterium]|nr:MAG: pyridoxal-phosphate dependent enzyme [Dehalococcoidia bacterium]